MSFDFDYTPSRGPDRSHARRQAEETIAITNRGSYVAPSGREVCIADDVRRALAGTTDITPDQIVALPSSPGARATRMRVVNGTSLMAARELAARGAEPFVLNFASAKNAGGGFRNGARAQEESLARASALYECIRGSGMYAHHRLHHDCLYTSWMIHSPKVPVFRDDDTGALLDEPYLCAFLTAAAPNAGVVLERQPERATEVERAMRSRVQLSLAVAAHHGHRHLVLGAWGCGVFRNDPSVVADAYRTELDGTFKGIFDEVVFAVLDWSADRHFVRPFAERFA